MEKVLSLKEFEEIRAEFAKEVNDILDFSKMEKINRFYVLGSGIDKLLEKDMSVTFSITNGRPCVDVKGCRAAIAFGCMLILRESFNGDGLEILLDFMLLDKMGAFDAESIKKHFESPEQKEVFKAAMNNPEIMEKIIKHMAENDK